MLDNGIQIAAACSHSSNYHSRCLKDIYADCYGVMVMGVGGETKYLSLQKFIAGWVIAMPEASPAGETLVN